MVPPDPTAPVVIDRAVLDRAVQSDPALLRRLVTILDEQQVRALAEIDAGHADGDATAVRLAAHRLKGALLSVGGFAAAEAAGAVLDLADAGRLEAVPAARADLTAALAALMQALAALVATTAP